MPVNGWQIILSALKSLQIQIDAGSIADEWYLNVAISSLRLLSAIIRSDSNHLPLFVHLQQAAQVLLMSMSQALKPNYELIACLLEFFAEVSKCNSSLVWNNLDGCPLLPSLPNTQFVRNRMGSDILLSYRAGNIRALICGEEAASGKFPILKHLCCLVETALKARLSHNIVRGTLVFVVKEVVPVMLQWRFCNVAERVAVIEGTFSLLHHALEEGCIDKKLQELVVCELSSAKGGAGGTLRAILEGCASLEATLDQPAEWPHSSHASKLTKMAKLALSLTHRLVGQYLTWSKDAGNNLSEFFLGGSINRNNQSSSNQGVWVTPRPPHLALTIAHFVHHRLNPRLPYLALRTLTRLAKELGVPLVACLGTEAEGLRDCLLTRLDSATEDLWVKIALLRLLTSSTLYQPGLIRLFLTPPAPLLDSVVSLLQLHNESKNEAGLELLCAVVELVASLWGGNFATATSYLRKKEEFWDGLSYCLCSKLPGKINDDLIGNIFEIYSLEYFGARGQVCERLQNSMKIFTNPNADKFTSWFEYIFVISLTKGAKIDDEEEKNDTEKVSNLLLTNSCKFLVVFITRSKCMITEEQKRFLGEKVLEGLLSLFESEKGSSSDSLQVVMSDIHLALVNQCGKVLVENSAYTSLLTRLLEGLCSSVMQTKAQCQVLILAGALKVLSNLTPGPNSQEFGFSLVTAGTILVEQHCSLAPVFVGEKSEKVNSIQCSSPLVLALSCTLLHQCLLLLPEEKIKTILEQSHLVYALTQAATKHTEVGNTGVVKEVLRLLSLLGRQLCCPSELSTNNLAVSVSLVLSSQSKFDYEILCDLLWCTIWCLKREGASGVEGAVSLAAVHLSTITNALAMPDTQADLALAAATLSATLAPYHRLWRVIHPQCFELLTTATACCIHRSTIMLRLKETLEREIYGDQVSSDGSSSGTISSATISLINKLLQILGTCLEALRFLSPDIVDLLCCPGIDLNLWNSSLIQPTSRRLSTEHPSTLPNLTTLADILDLYQFVVPKDGRNFSPLKSSLSGNNMGSKCINVSLLTHCAEEALLLLLSYSALLLMSPNVQPREARDIRTFLGDETTSFFSHWIGKRPATSPLPLLCPGLSLSNMPYLLLCRQIVTSLCNTKKN